MSTNVEDDSDGMLPEYDFSRATRADGPLFPDGFGIRIDGAVGYSLRLIPSSKVVGRFKTTNEAWPVILAEVERGIPPRCLILDCHLADGARGAVGGGRLLVVTARAGLGLDTVHQTVRAAS
jgi:hypothetical protein